MASFIWYKEACSFTSKSYQSDLDYYNENVRYYIILDLTFWLKYNKKVFPEFTKAFCGSILNIINNTKYEGGFDYLCSLLISSSFEWAETAPIISRNHLWVLKPNLINIIHWLVKYWEPKIIQKWRILPHSLYNHKLTWKIWSICDISKFSSTSIMKKLTIYSSDWSK